jgi:hypothetical protein
MVQLQIPSHNFTMKKACAILELALEQISDPDAACSFQFLL